MKGKLEETASITEEMCMSKHPMVNSTHIGDDNLVALINNLWIFSSHTDEHGQTHHSASTDLYVILIVLFVMMIMALGIAFLCLWKGAVWEGFYNLICGRRNNSPNQQQHNQPSMEMGPLSHMSEEQMAQMANMATMAQMANMTTLAPQRRGSGYFNRFMPRVPEIK